MVVVFHHVVTQEAARRDLGRIVREQEDEQPACVVRDVVVLDERVDAVLDLDPRNVLIYVVSNR